MEVVEGGPGVVQGVAGPTGAVPEAFVKKMTWRAVGPASMGGRITALAVVESDPATYYVATASGGSPASAKSIGPALMRPSMPPPP